MTRRCDNSNKRAFKAREEAWRSNRSLTIAEVEELRKKKRRLSEGELLALHQHGSYQRYKLGCHCDECRAANAAYMRGWLANKPGYYSPEARARRRNQG